MNEKLVNKLTWLLIFSSLLYLGYILVNYSLGDWQQYVFIKDSGHSTKARYLLNLYYSIFGMIMAIWTLFTVVTFLLKKRYFKQNIINLYLIYGFFLAFTFLISEYFTVEYIFYFYKTSKSRLLLLFSYSVIYSGIAMIASHSNYIKNRFIL